MPSLPIYWIWARRYGIPLMEAIPLDLRIDKPWDHDNFRKWFSEASLGSGGMKILCLHYLLDQLGNVYRHYRSMGEEWLEVKFWSEFVPELYSMAGSRESLMVARWVWDRRDEILSQIRHDYWIRIRIVEALFLAPWRAFRKLGSTILRCRTRSGNDVC